MLTEENLRKILTDKVMGIDTDKIGIETEFSDVGIDSLDHAVLLLSLDEEFGIKIPDKDVERCNSIKNILLYVKEVNP